MQIIRNIKDGEFGLEGEVYFSLFHKFINLRINDNADIPYVENCAAYLNTLPDSTITDLCDASIRYCNGFLSEVGESQREFDNPLEVLGLIYPSELIIPKAQCGDEPVIRMELNCAWEEEHGMEWIVRKDKVLYVGPFYGENPWRDFSQKDSWNYA